MNVKPHPRLKNPYVYDDQPIVVKVPHMNGDSLLRSVDRGIDLLGGLDRTFSPGDRVMIKPNFNCEYALPLSTDLAFLTSVIEYLQDFGCDVVVGEMSGRAAGPTERVVGLLGVEKALKRYGVTFIDFEKDEWVTLDIGGEYWETLQVPLSMYEAEKRVYIANMRCHSTGRYTSSLKLSVGWINEQERERLHSDRENVGRKIPELNSGWQPNLVLVDGRRSTVGWHGRGDYVYPNIIMTSGDMVAIDGEAVRILKGYPAENRLDIPVHEIEQLAGAAKLGLGSLDAMVMEAPCNCQTDQPSLDARELGKKGSKASE